MSSVVLIDRSYSNRDAVEQLIAYCLHVDINNLNKFNNEVIYGCFGVNSLSPKTVINSMKNVKRWYHKEDGKLMHHVVLSLYTKRKSRVEERVKIASFVANDIGQFINYLGYQNITAIHVTYEYNVHIHIALNSVNYLTGKKLSKTKQFSDSITKFLRNNYNFLKWENIFYNRGNI